MTLSAGKFRSMRRIADPGGRYKMLAVDQRPSIRNLIRGTLNPDEAAHPLFAGKAGIAVSDGSFRSRYPGMGD